MDDLALNYQSDFNAILQMIADGRRKASYQVNATMIDLYWGIGELENLFPIRPCRMAGDVLP